MILCSRKTFLLGTLFSLLFTGFCLFSGFSCAAFAAGGPKLVIDGQSISGDMKPVNIGGRMLVSVRVISESMGAQVEWLKQENSVKITSGDKVLVIPIGGKIATVNGTAVRLDVPAQLVGSRTYMPIRFLSENLGAWVEWDKPAETAYVYTKASNLNSLNFELTQDGLLLSLNADTPVHLKQVSQDATGIVFAMPYTHLTEGPRQLNLGMAGVTGMVTEQASTDPPTAMLRIDTEGSLDHIIKSSDNTTTILFPYTVHAIEMRTDSGKEQFAIKSNGPLDYHVVDLNDTSFALDFQGVMLDVDPVSLVFGNPDIKSVSAVQKSTNPNIVRVVFALSEKLPYRTLKSFSNGEVVVELAPRMTLVKAEALNDRTRLSFTASGDIGTDFSVTQGANKQLLIDFPFMKWDAGNAQIRGGTKNVSTMQYVEDKAWPKRVRIAVNQLAATTWSVVPDQPAHIFVVDIFDSPLAGKRIVIDPGHGGADSGTISASQGKESDYNLRIAKLLAAKLVSAGADVKMTRFQDETVALGDRVSFANDAAADAFVSIHHNSANGTASGTETFYYNSNPGSSVLAALADKRLVQELGAVDRGAKSNNFWVVKDTVMPAILAEICFIDNPQQDQMILLPDRQNAAATGLYMALNDFFLGTQAQKR